MCLVTNEEGIRMTLQYCTHGQHIPLIKSYDALKDGYWCGLESITFLG